MLAIVASSDGTRVVSRYLRAGGGGEVEVEGRVVFVLAPFFPPSILNIYLR